MPCFFVNFATSLSSFFYLNHISADISYTHIIRTKEKITVTCISEYASLVWLFVKHDKTHTYAKSHQHTVLVHTRTYKSSSKQRKKSPTNYLSELFDVRIISQNCQVSWCVYLLFTSLKCSFIKTSHVRVIHYKVYSCIDV